MKSLLTALLLVSMTALLAQAQVTGEIRDGKIVVIATEPVAAAGLDLISAGGLMVPVPDPPGASPFTFFLSNTPNQITWGNLGSTVTFDGEFATNAGYTGDDPAGDLTAAWGNGPTPVAFPVTGAAVVEPPVVTPPVVTPPVTPPVGNETIPEPTAGLLSVFAALGVLGFRRRRN